MCKGLLGLLGAVAAVHGLRVHPHVPSKLAISARPLLWVPQSDAKSVVMLQQGERTTPRIVIAWRILRTDLIGRASNRIALAVSSGLSGREGLRRRRRKVGSARGDRRRGNGGRGQSASASPVMLSSAALATPAASGPAAVEKQRRDGSTPTVEQVKARHYLIRKLVWLDTEGLLQRFARQQPWESGDALQDHLRGLEHRSPIIQWTFRHQVGKPRRYPRPVPRPQRLPELPAARSTAVWWSRRRTSQRHPCARPPRRDRSSVPPASSSRRAVRRRSCRRCAGYRRARRSGARSSRPRSSA